MSFRRYVATTVREGLDRVRRELGDDAVILSNKRLGPGRIGRSRRRHRRGRAPRCAPSPRRRALAWRCTTRWPGRTLSPRPQPHPKRYWHTRWRHRRCSASAPHATPRCPPRRSPERHHRLRSTLVRPRRLRSKPRRRARRHRRRPTAPRSVRRRHRLRQTAPRPARRRQRRRPTAPRLVRPRRQLPKRPRHRSRHRHPNRCRRWPLCRKSVRSQTPRWTTPG